MCFYVCMENWESFMVFNISETKKGSQQYKGTSYDHKSEHKTTGVMCSWFTSTSNPKVFELNNDITERIMATLFLVCTAILVYTFLMMF